MSISALTNLRDYLIGTLSKEDMIWLTTELVGHSKEEEELKPYTKEELLAMAEAGRQQIANGQCYTDEEVFHDLLGETEEELELELAEAV